MTSTSSAHSPLARLFRYAKPHRRQMYLATSYSFLNKVFDLAPPALIGAAVDTVVKKENSLIASFGFPDLMHQLWILTALTVIIWGVESIFEYAYAWEWRNLAQTVQHEMRLETYQHIQTLEMAYFEDRSTGGLMSVLNDDINQLERFLDGGANDFIQVMTTVLVVSAVFLYTSPLLALLAILPMPFVLWGSLAFQKRIAPRYASVRERVGLLNGQLANNLSGIETIKSFTAETHETERIRQESEAYRQANRHTIRLSAAFIPLIRMVIVFGFISTMVLGGWMTAKGQMEVGTYSVLVYLTQRLLWPLTRLGATFDLYQRAMASTTRVLDMLDTPVQILSGHTALPTKEVKGDIQFKDVSFAYPDRDPLLRDLQLHIPAGQTTAIVGATGSGKSTLVRMLLRFYDNQEGSIVVDGHELKSLQLDDLRHAVGLVSQHVFLFHGTVRENITYGSFDASDEAIIQAARTAEAHDFIEALPEGYDTLIGERGQKLSGGQQQRLSLARAILKDPPILILDEATSAVDNETEAAIQRSLEHITQNRTTLIIAHRLSTIRHADQIVVLDRGEIKERGRHEELLARQGLYARLWGVQTGQRDT